MTREIRPRGRPCCTKGGITGLTSCGGLGKAFGCGRKLCEGHRGGVAVPGAVRLGDRSGGAQLVTGWSRTTGFASDQRGGASLGVAAKASSSTMPVGGFCGLGGKEAVRTSVAGASPYARAFKELDAVSTSPITSVKVLKP